MSAGLFDPLKIRSVELRNRVVISPMCQYSAKNGYAQDWHLVHLGSFAKGGAGLVFTEAAATEPRGRISHGDLGIWEDGHVEPLTRIADFVRGEGAVPGLQIAHAGRKANMQRPWEGGQPLDQVDTNPEEPSWQVIGPTDEPVNSEWQRPHAMSIEEVHQAIDKYAAAAERGLRAGFEALEIHGAHGYLIHTFLSPLTNKRTDEYGGDLQGRMRFALEVVEKVRGVWPDHLPLFIRISSVDGPEEGWNLEDSVTLARELKERGVDVVDCSSGGFAGAPVWRPPEDPDAARRQGTGNAPWRTPGFQVPYADRIRREAGVMTQAVGLILRPRQAEEIIRSGSADLVALARQALYDPYWALHAARALDVDPEFDLWPPQYGWWLFRRARGVGREIEFQMD